MEHAQKVLMLGFYVWMFAMSLTVIILMYRQVDSLYNETKSYVSVRSVLEEDVLER